MEKVILLNHGSGGRKSHQLIEEIIAPVLKNRYLAPLDDGAVLPGAEKLVMTTDSYVVDPIFFPGGNIGKLAVCGTVNDLAVMGATPRFLSVGLILEEGLPIADLQKILQSMAETAEQAGVELVTGDTKVVPHGSADKIFINTAGIGVLEKEPERRIQEGDRIIISGSIGDHGTTIMAARSGLALQAEIRSDCAPLNGLIAELAEFAEEIHIMRDPTRGGIATTLNEWAETHGLGIQLEERQLPVTPAVGSVCEMLGLDPLYLANEGKLLLAVSGKAAESILGKIRNHPLGKKARIIGEVVAEPPGRVFLQTAFGSRRVVDMLSGEPLPRIC
ncbi:MAG: hydrogenase expression/formation protein HypE [Calditrichia bacterium]